MVFSLACPTCCKGWKSAYPQEHCGRCGHLCQTRGHYQIINLDRTHR